MKKLFEPLTGNYATGCWRFIIAEFSNNVTLVNVASVKELCNTGLWCAYISLDLKTLYLERVEILLRIVPNDQELKAYREYERERKPTSLLSEEDRFMICVSIILVVCIHCCLLKKVYLYLFIF